MNDVYLDVIKTLWNIVNTRQMNMELEVSRLQACDSGFVRKLETLFSGI